MKPTIIPTHTKVRGRARFKIESLARSTELRQRADAAVRRLPGVKGVKINSVTGSLLVHFEPEEDWRSIAGRIAGVVEKEDGDDSKSIRNEAGPLPLAFDNESGVPFKWHQLAADRIAELVDTSVAQGLDPESAEHRLRIHGSNVIPGGRLRSRTETLRDQLMFLPSVLLLAEFAVALFGGAVIEAALLAIVMAVNVLVGYFIDRRAERAIAVFKRRPQPSALGLRGGNWIKVPGEGLVVGDV